MNEEQTRLFETDDDEIPASQSNEEKTTSEQGQESSEEERIKQWQQVKNMEITLKHK